MKKLIFLIGLLMAIAPSVAVCGAMPQVDYPILAQQSQEAPGYPPRQSEGDNIATPQGPGKHSGEIAPGGAGTPYGTPSQKSTTPGYPMKQQEGDPYATPGTPAERSQQGGSQSR